MTVVNLIRRYERWNPVHPTYGAFWGIGLGLGCGVGWGPGFGPEAVGFVGSGCGVGFSVGVTFIGFGIGLPASGLTCLPSNMLVWTGQGASSVTSNFLFPALVFTARQTWEALSLQATALESGIQHLCRSQMPKGRKFVLDSRRQFLKRIQESQNRAAIRDGSVLQQNPWYAYQESNSPTRPQSVPLSQFPRVPPGKGRDS